MRIVMTGGTAGIGLVAAQRLAASGAELVIGARRPGTVPKGLAGRAKLLPLDLAHLDQARDFAEHLAAGPPIDVLLLNAGLQAVKGERSVQGHELTFAANHLAHLVILMGLKGAMAPGGRIVLTASGTHDPAEKTGMPPPRHADARMLADPASDPDLDRDQGVAGRRAYSTSKLCNVMTAREAAARFGKARPDLAIAAFDPGFTPGTGLARGYPPPLSFLFRHVLPLIVRGERVSTPENSGRLLAELAVEPQWAGMRGDYVAVRGKGLKVVPPSELARDAEACRRLWEDSLALIG